MLKQRTARERIAAALELLGSEKITRGYHPHEIKQVGQLLRSDRELCYSDEQVHRGKLEASLTYIDSKRNHSQTNGEHEVFYSYLYSDGTLSIKFGGNPEYSNSMRASISFSNRAIRSLVETYREHFKDSQLRKD